MNRRMIRAKAARKFYAAKCRRCLRRQGACMRHDDVVEPLPAYLWKTVLDVAARPGQSTRDWLMGDWPLPPAEPPPLLPSFRCDGRLRWSPLLCKCGGTGATCEHCQSHQIPGCPPPSAHVGGAVTPRPPRSATEHGSEFIIPAGSKVYAKHPDGSRKLVGEVVSFTLTPRTQPKPVKARAWCPLLCECDGVGPECAYCAGFEKGLV